MLSLSVTSTRAAGGLFARTGLKHTTKSGVLRMLSGDASADAFVFHVSHADFQEKVIKSKVPVILDCYADWCGPCKTLGPLLEAAVRKQNGKVLMAKLDTDNNPEVSSALNIKSLPTVYGITNGQMVENFIGLQSPEYIDEFVQKMIASASGTPHSNP